VFLCILVLVSVHVCASACLCAVCLCVCVCVRHDLAEPLENCARSLSLSLKHTEGLSPSLPQGFSLSFSEGLFILYTTNHSSV